MGKASVRAVVIVIALGIAACGAAIPPVHGKGGPAWRELASEHFTVWTDGDPARARELMREMEYLRRVVVGVMFPSSPASGRMLVIALRDDDELAAFSSTGEPRPFAISAHPPLRQPLIVMSVFSNRDPSDQRLAHELTHVISFGVLHYQPRWLAEGMAQFFENVRLDADAATADVGDAPKVDIDLRSQLVPIAKLFKWKGLSSNEEREYRTAWAVFMFLYNTRAKELVQYLQLLQRDGETSPDQMERTWNEAFPSLRFGDVDVELQQWLITGRHDVMRVKMEQHRWPVTERTLGDADTYAIRGALRIELDQRAQGRAEVTAALELEPNHALARVLLVALDNKMITVEQARALVAAHPDDWRAWWLATLAIEEVGGDVAEYEAARAKTCAMVAQNAALAPPRPLCTASGDRAPVAKQLEPPAVKPPSDVRTPSISADIEAAITLAASQLSAGDAAGARKTLVVAETRLASLAPDKAAAGWLLLAEQYRAMGALTWAEGALAQAGVGADARHEIAVWAATARARYGIPRDGARWKLTPDDEAAATAAVRDAVALVNAGDHDAAAKAIAAAELRWPSLPGVLTARCALDFRRDAMAAARRQCDRAIAQGGSSWALYLRGIIELKSRRGTAAGIARLREAIALDPDLVQAWRALGEALDRTKATAELEQLRQDYRARFNARLPN